MYVCKYVPGANPTIFEFTATTPVEFLNQRKIIFNLKTHHAINSAVSFYNAGVVTRDRRIGSWCPILMFRININEGYISMRFRTLLEQINQLIWSLFPWETLVYVSLMNLE
jgi:hypothetical protein